MFVADLFAVEKTPYKEWSNKVLSLFLVVFFCRTSRGGESYVLGDAQPLFVERG